MSLRSREVIHRVVKQVWVAHCDGCDVARGEPAEDDGWLTAYSTATHTTTHYCPTCKPGRKAKEAKP